MPTYYSENQYEGKEAIVVAMDIGTTQSAISFVYFSPGDRPCVEMVTHWPGQPDWAAKTPSVVSYSGSIVKACGAEALQDFDELDVDVAYWFKLHLHPPLMTSSAKPQGFEIPPLPPGITTEQVYSDLMHYLMKNTQRSFENTTPNGAEIWARLRNAVVIVLATPNGWDIREQTTLRKAAIRASLVTEENAGQLLQFVTEASVHYALAQQTGEWLRENTVFAVIDCGGSTVDTAVYQCVSPSPLTIKETCPSECVQAGGIFVNSRVKEALETKLKGSAFGNPETIRRMIDAFERELKPRFNGIKDQYDLDFGVPRDSDPRLGIYKGKIRLPDKDLKPAFDAVIDKIVTSCSSIITSQNTEYVLIVGGFGESPYLRDRLSRHLAPYAQVVRVRDHTTKAAAEGVIIGHIAQFVVARAAKATFGGCVRPLYHRRLHRERRHAVQPYADGKERVHGAFHVWITKGTVLRGNFAYKLSYHVAWDATSTSKSELCLQLQTVGIEVFAWERDGTPPIWCKDERGAVLEGMRLICTLNADLSQLAGGLRIMTGPHGARFYRVDYEVCVYFGGTQLRANLRWKEGGAIREGPVAVMP